MLSDQEINQLEEVLFAPEWGEDALDFFGLHGAICASVVGPQALSTQALFAVATGREPDAVDEVPEVFASITERVARAIRQMLEQGHDVELPEPDGGGSADDALENWCAGFVDAFLLAEDQWLETAEDAVASLLAPIMTLSNLFDDEAFQQARKDPKRYRRYADEIPDSLTDLYLHFHSP